jgi:NAD(P)-dependent dehydrogenase (short-subunit alcohol dehydrogenase family)
MADINGKVALVTGASMGIGKGVARALAQEGCSVALAARTADALEKAAAEIGGLGVEVASRPTDVADPGQVEKLFDLVKERFGRLDILVNNAAVFDDGPIDELSVEAWDHVMAVNLRGPFLCTSAAMKMMKKQSGGRIINISSIAAKRVRPETAAYSTSKAGLWGLSQVTALEGRDYGITCSCVYPGNTKVERRQESSDVQDQEPMVAIEEMATVVKTIALLPPHVQVLEATVMPHKQLFVGRG